MISIITGKLGGGKTLYCVGRMVEHLAKGGTIATNVDLVWQELVDLVKRRYRRILRPEQLMRVDLAECARWHAVIPWGVPEFPVLVVLDEIHLFFNARDWKKTEELHRDMLSFLSQSRKANIDVLFIAQVAATLEKQFRDQSEWEFYCRNLRDVHVPLLGRMPLNRLLLVQRDNNSQTVARRQIMNFDRALFPVYDTRSFLDGQMRELAKSAKRVPPFKLQRVPRVTTSKVVAMVVVAVVLLVRYHHLFLPR